MWLTKEQIDKHIPNAQSYVNCAGYAFGVNGWYEPADSEKEAWKKFSPHPKKNGEPWRDWERRYVRRILRDFPEWKLISSKLIDNLEIDPEEYEIVAMRLRRIYVFHDFHFMRCEPNGNWTDKNGSDPEIHSRRYEQIYDKWNGNYDGKIYFFAKPRKIKPSTPKVKCGMRGISTTQFTKWTEWKPLKTEHVPFYRKIA